MKIDETDRRILRALQRDATLSMDALAEAAHLSRNACWRRMRQMEAEGIIRARVALVDAQAAGCPQEVLIMIRAGAHDPDWLTRFARAIATLPEIVAAYRMTGELDYVLRVRVADVPSYDRLYRKLIALVPLSDISASFVMEHIKDSTELPL